MIPEEDLLMLVWAIFGGGLVAGSLVTLAAVVVWAWMS